jgi:UDP-N-acetylglucosamine acyltransferase
MNIHPTAVVSSRAELGQGVRIGPYCVIGDHVTIGAYTTIASHVVLEGKIQIGEQNEIYPFASIGLPPQDVGYRGEGTCVVMGDNNRIREYATIHRATTKEEWKTVIGNDNYLMAYTHVAHDCRLGDHIILANVATLGGHTHVGNHASIAGLVAVHQFVRIGDYAFIGGHSGVDRDIPPFMLTSGPRAKLYGINRRGLARHGFSQKTIDSLKKVYTIIWRRKLRLEEGIAQVRKECESSPEIELLLGFLKNTKRGILR